MILCFVSVSFIPLINLGFKLLLIKLAYRDKKGRRVRATVNLSPWQKLANNFSKNVQSRETLASPVKYRSDDNLRIDLSPLGEEVDSNCILVSLLMLTQVSSWVCRRNSMMRCLIKGEYRFIPLVGREVC